MDITLKVKTEVLKEKAADVTRDTKELENHFSGIQDIVARSTGYWVGTAGDKARKEFDGQKEDITKIIRRFKEHPGDLLSMAGIYDAVEQEAVFSSKELATDVIR